VSPLNAAPDLDVFAASDLSEVFLRLERLVRAVVIRRRADHAQTRLDYISTFREDEKLTEERHGHQFAVQLGRHAGNLGEALAVEQPEPAASRHTTARYLLFARQARGWRRNVDRRARTIFKKAGGLGQKLSYIM